MAHGGNNFTRNLGFFDGENCFNTFSYKDTSVSFVLLKGYEGTFGNPVLKFEELFSFRGKSPCSLFYKFYELYGLKLPVLFSLKCYQYWMLSYLLLALIGEVCAFGNEAHVGT